MWRKKEDESEGKSDHRISLAAVKDSVVSVTGKVKHNVHEAGKKTARFIGGHDDLSWKEIQKIEKRRRAVLRRSHLPFYRILTFWDGTTLSVLVSDPLMWICLLLYIAVRLQAHWGLPDSIESLATGDISVIGGFLSFFLVFYVVQTNNRFYTLYNFSMAIKGRTFDVASLARTTLPRSSGQKIVRYMNAANIACYVGMDNCYTFNNFFIPLNETNCFLTSEEVDRMMRINMGVGGSCSRELYTWTLAEVDKNLKAGVIDSQLAYQYRDYMLQARAAVGQLFNYKDQPVSFFYLHFLTLLSTFYLPLFAISTAYQAGSGDNAFWGSDIISGLIVMLQCVFVIGLRLLGQKMSDPFGDDIEDLSVLEYINFTWKNSMRILYSEDAPDVSADQEDSIARMHRSIGEAWEDNRTQFRSNEMSDMQESII